MKTQKKLNISKSQTVPATAMSKERPKPPEHYLKKSSQVEPLEPIDIVEFVRMAIPKQELILGKWLRSQGLCMIHGARGEGKTHLAFGIACAVASGQDFLGWECPVAKKVAYLDGEMAAGMLQERVKRIPKRMRPSKGMLNLVTPDFQRGMLPDISSRDQHDFINAAIDSDTKLIVVDNLSSWSKSGREDAETWVPTAEWALRHRSEGRSVLFVHHSGKAGTQRGTSRREDLLDVVLGLRKPQNWSPTDGAHFEIHFEKNRHLAGQDVKPINAQLVADSDNKNDWEYGVVEGGAAERYEDILELKAQGMNQSEIAKKLSVNRSTVCRALRGARSAKRPVLHVANA